MVDRGRGVLWSKVAQSEGNPLEIVIPLDRGVAGRVAQTGVPINSADAYRESWFDPSVDARTGYRTRSLLRVPLKDSKGQVFAVAQLLNKVNGLAFDAADQEGLQTFTNPIGVLLQTWLRMSKQPICAAGP